MITSFRNGRSCYLLIVSALWCIILYACAGTNKVLTGPVTIAVWPFEDLSTGLGSDPTFMPILTDAVLMTIQAQPDLQTVERSQLEAILREQHLGSSQLADQSVRLRLGRLLGARYMVFATYQSIGNMVRLDMRLVDVETSRLVAAESDIVQALDEMSVIDTAKRLSKDLVSQICCGKT